MVGQEHLKRIRKNVSYWVMVMATIFWGFSFVAAKVVLEDVSSTALIFYRSILAFFIGLSICVVIHRIRWIQWRVALEKSFWPAFFLFLTIALQNAGLSTISASKASFLASLSVVIIPILEVTFYRDQPFGFRHIWIIGMALLGMFLISYKADGIGVMEGGGQYCLQSFCAGWGEFLFLLSAVTASMQVLTIARGVGQTAQKKVRFEVSGLNLTGTLTKLSTRIPHLKSKITLLGGRSGSGVLEDSRIPGGSMPSMTPSVSRASATSEASQVGLFFFSPLLFSTAVSFWIMCMSGFWGGFTELDLLSSRWDLFRFSFGDWMYFLSLAIGASLLAFSFQAYAQRKISSFMIALICLLEAPFGLLFGFLFLGEVLNWVQFLGAVLILICSGILPLFALEPTSQAHSNRENLG